MKTIRCAALSMLLLGAVATPEAFAETAAPQSPSTTTSVAQAKRATRPNPPAEITEVRPGFSVNGTPNKPIFSGDMPIYPEAYDYMPAKEP